MGGTQGIRLGPLGPGPSPVHRPLASFVTNLPRLASLTGQSQRWIVAYGRVLVLGLILLGAAALVLGAVAIHGLALPWLFYLPPLAASGLCWSGALVAHALRRSSRRALMAATEQDILQLATRTQGPLTVQETARSLGLSLAEAERALTAMAHSGYLAMDVDLDTGNLHFIAPRSLCPHDPSTMDLRR